MLAESSPVVARWELSRRLAARRKELGIDVKTITNALGFTRNYWSAVENDRTLIAEDKLRLLFDVLSFDDENQSELLQLREDSRKKGWWDEYSALDSLAKRFYGMEYGAQTIRSYEGHMIPGVLQLPEYSRALIQADPFFSSLDIEPALAVRKRRQRELLKTDHRRLVVILSEAALRQQVAGRLVQAQQLRQLSELANKSPAEVEIRVIPLSLNPGIIAGSSTLLFLDFRSEHLPMAAYQEAVRPPDTILEEDEQFRRLDLAWQDGFNRSLPPEQSAEMIEAVAVAL